MPASQKQDPYCYEGTEVFINTREIRDIEILKQYEGAVALMRMVELSRNPISGDHSLAQWQAIHRHIFQDVYSWAGKLRSISLFEEYESPYSSPETITTGFNKLVVPLLEKTNHLCDSTDQGIVKDISDLMGELYYLHPFRDGNTRSLIQFVKEISRNAGIQIDLSNLTGSQWADLQHGIVLAAHEQSTRLLESTLSTAVSRKVESVVIDRDNLTNDSRPKNSSSTSIQAVQREHTHLLDTATTYTDRLKTCTQAKEGQAQRIESKLEKVVAVQQAIVTESRAHRPGLVSSLWRGKAWEQRHQSQVARLQTLERRLDQVRGIRVDMGGKRLAELARKKLQRDMPELVARHDAEERIKRERQTEETIQKNALRQTREKGLTQGRGRGIKLER